MVDSEGTSADREIQRTLMELLNQMDGFDSLGKVKIIMATKQINKMEIFGISSTTNAIIPKKLSNNKPNITVPYCVI